MTLSVAPQPPGERSGQPRDRAPDADGDGPGRWWLTLAPTQPAPGLIVVRVRGELDASTAGRCRDVLRAAVLAVAREITQGRATAPDSSGPSAGRLVCDLDGVGFLSAAGLGVLVEVDRHARAHGVELTLFATGRPVLRVLALTGLDRQLRLERTLDGAGAVRVTAGAS